LLLKDLLIQLNNELQAQSVPDYCPNGLQVEGSATVHKIVTGVTATKALIDAAIENNADAILVHHGYFWKGETPNIVGMKKKRLKKLLHHDISLLAYHLPIDIHPSLGNNAQLGKLLGLENIKSVPGIMPEGIVMQGDFNQALAHRDVRNLLGERLRRDAISIGNKDAIKRIAWCTGGGQNYIDQVALQDDLHIDAFLSGEISEQTTHSAIEQNIDFFAAGHHATERYGVKAVGEWLAEAFDVEVMFIDIDNPA
jgi:dinuclear metal center YbgI/SA1388 family protein